MQISTMGEINEATLFDFKGLMIVMLASFLVPILGMDGERALGEKALFQGVGRVKGRGCMLFHAVFVTIRVAQGNAEEGLRGITHSRASLSPGYFEAMACPLRRKAPD